MKIRNLGWDGWKWTVSLLVLIFHHYVRLSMFHLVVPFLRTGSWLKLYWSVAHSDKFIIPISAIDSDVMPLKPCIWPGYIQTQDPQISSCNLRKEQDFLLVILIPIETTLLEHPARKSHQYQVKYKTTYCTRTAHQLRYAWTNWMRRYCYWSLPLNLSVH